MRNKYTGGSVSLTAAVLLSSLGAIFEYVSFMHLPVPAAQGMIVFSFLFDVLFASLFIVDAAEAVKRKHFRIFMLYGRGLIDFCGSFPVLLLFSAPSAVIIAAGTDPASAVFVNHLTAFWNSLCVTGILRVSRMARLVSQQTSGLSPMTERHITFLCSVVCTAAAAAVPLCSYVMRFSPLFAGDGARYLYSYTGFVSSLLLFAVLSVIVSVYSGHFGNTVSSVLGALDSGFRRREFYLKIKVREQFRDEEIFRIASFYNESYLPAKMKQNINSDEPAAYRVPDEDVINFLRGR